ncbi:hypothetical protein O3G_MSEX008382 [Manduca sexta]|uniref:Methionyl/Valyl/Leucyl/Isoleucyl-tRNA synthetase anticodon-binding domain-containing protein n=1 Tax=Manduca sexta TaxID=7130 RepID=A0A921ZAK6_MANSE|nr:hypothetical protein O3G_MSEX008382 [Manduca sexta]
MYGIKNDYRWWVASHATQHSQIVVSKKLLDDCQNEVIRVRNIMRYLLSVISDVDKDKFHRKLTLNYFDSYMVKETENFTKQIFDHYDNFRYNHAAQSILYFVSNKVSGLYCHCVKDRLYCSQKDSAERLSAQLVVNTILISLCKALGPILPHLIEEAWQHHPLFEKPFYFTMVKPVLPAENIDVSIMDAILDIKKDVCVLAKNESLKKFSAKIYTNSNLYQKLTPLNKINGNDSVLCEILELSSVSLELSDVDSWRVELSPSSGGQCLRCRRYNTKKGSDKCLRCETVLAAL